jgi:replicative DNA helicase
LIVVAGFPSTGKTALAVNIAVHCALNKIPAAIFSAEMRPVQLVIRSLCSNARANYHHLFQEDIARMIPEVARLSKAPIFIEPAQGMSIGQVVAVARRLKQKHGIQIVVVDYIQLLSGIGDNREQQVSSISKGLKAMALELEVAVLALSQLTDDGKLRESRAIGQDADTIWKLENEGEWQPKVQPIKINIEKCRDGETGKVDLTFLKEFTRFECVSKFGAVDAQYPHNNN